MALNRTILKKINEKTIEDKGQKDFIVEILEKENKGLGNYTKVYKELVEKSIEKGDE